MISGRKRSRRALRVIRTAFASQLPQRERIVRTRSSGWGKRRLAARARQASSMAAVLMSAGAKGKRFALPYSRFLLHQLTAGIQGQASDIDIQAREIIRIGHIIDDILVKHTGQPLEIIRRDSDRDFYMSAEEAKTYGLIDEIFLRQKKTP